MHTRSRSYDVEILELDGVSPNVRKYILEALSSTNQTMSLYRLKNYIESKEPGLSKGEGVKMVLRRMVRHGHVIQVDASHFRIRPTNIESASSSTDTVQDIGEGGEMDPEGADGEE